MLKWCVACFIALFVYSPLVNAETALETSASAFKSKEASSNAVQWFAGLAYGRSSFILNNVYVASAKYKTKASAGDAALLLGAHIGRSRVYATVHAYNSGSDVRLRHYSASFDTKLIDFPLAPFAGLSVGYASWEERGLQAKNPGFVITSNNVTAKDNIKISGVTYGVKLGVLYEVGDFDVRMGFDITKANASDTVYFDGIAERFEMKMMRSYFMNVNYKF